MERNIDRFDKYLKYKDFSDNKVTLDLGMSIGLLGKSRKPDSDLSKKTIEKILNFYTDINRTWLLTGEGKMLKPETKNENEPINQQIMDEKERIGILEEALEIMKRELQDKQRTIDQLAESNRELISYVTGSVGSKKKEAI